MKIKNISVAGLGKLGACLAACFAYRGIRTLGIDVVTETVDAINAGRAPVEEPGLSELIYKAGNLLSATLDHGRAIRETDITFILVPTPSETHGSFSNRFITNALGSLATELSKSKKGKHIFVICSTVMPTSIKNQLIPFTEELSGRTCGKGFDMLYCPEWVALGSVIKNFLRPDLVLIGGGTETSQTAIEKLYDRMNENNPPVFKTSLINAELAKVMLNNYLVTKITFANQVGQICEEIPGADADEVARVIGADTRIGRKFLMAGLSFGGYCFPRDTKAYIALAKQLRADATLILAVDEINKMQDARLLKLVLDESVGKKVGVLGLSFKPGTPNTERSPGMALVRGLLDAKRDVSVYDPQAMENARAELGDTVFYCDSPTECVKKSHVVVFTMPWPQFAEIGAKAFRGGKTVIDCWRMFTAEEEPKHLAIRKLTKYIALGKGNDKTD